MKEKTEVKEGMKIKDNDPRVGVRIGVVKKINLGGTRAEVLWDGMGRTTMIRVDRIGVRSRTGYSIVEQP